MKDKRRLGHAIACFCILIWSINGIFTKNVVALYTPATASVVKLSIAYVVYWILNHTWIKFDWKYEKFFILAGLSGVTLYSFICNLAYSIAPASVVGVFINISPIFIALITVFILRQGKLSKYFVIGFFIAAFGMAFVSLDGAKNLHIDIWGVIVPILAAVSFAVYSVTLGQLMDLHLDSILIARRTTFWGVLMTLPMFFFQSWNFTFASLNSGELIFELLFLGIVATGVSTICWNKAIECLGTIVSSIYIYIMPAANVIASVIVFKDNVTWMTYIGVILIIIGVYVSGRKEKEAVDGKD